MRTHSSQYNPDDINTGILHIGLGAFMRAHLAVYTEGVLNASGGDWGICAVNIRSNREIVDALNNQNCTYHIAEYKSFNDLVLRQISAVKEVMFAGDDSTLLLERLQDKAIKIVSLSITEKGYYLNPADKLLLQNDEKIIYDLKNPESPKTALGILAVALKHRYENDIEPFTLMSCDNMPNNGDSLKSALVQFTTLHNPDLAHWIDTSVKCPSTMVDRIVPALTDASRAEVNRLLSIENQDHQQDNAVVACENFSQWIIEDDFPLGRPQWEIAGAEFVKDVAPFEEMKIRMLNGSHSLLAYLGSLGKLEYVSDCMQEPDFVALIKRYMQEEAMPTLQMPDNIDLSAYMESLLDRFCNDSLQHKTTQIAMDGSLKIPQRWLTGIDILLNKNIIPIASALGIAAWMTYVSGIDEQGQEIEVSDPIAKELRSISDKNPNNNERVKALLQTQVFSQTELVLNKEFVDKVSQFYDQLSSAGARETVRKLIEGC